MATNHDETLQERYARELAAMEPKTPMVKVMASNWQEDSLAPTWQQLHKAQTEYDELRARVVVLEVENAELKAKLTKKAELLRGCYAADHKQKQRIEELTAERDELRAELERIKANPVHQFRKSRCADWFDGLPDHTDGGGPYETRTLYALGSKTA